MDITADFVLKSFWVQFLVGNRFILFHWPRKYDSLKYKIFMAVTMEITGFWDLAPYILVQNDVSEPRIFFVIGVYKRGGCSRCPWNVGTHRIHYLRGTKRSVSILVSTNATLEPCST